MLGRHDGERGLLGEAVGQVRAEGGARHLGALPLLLRFPLHLRPLLPMDTLSQASTLVTELGGNFPHFKGTGSRERNANIFLMDSSGSKKSLVMVFKLWRWSSVVFATFSVVKVKPYEKNYIYWIFFPNYCAALLVSLWRSVDELLILLIHCSSSNININLYQ